MNWALNFGKLGFHNARVGAYMDYLNTWGYYRGFVGISDGMVDDECREAFNSIHPHGKVFYCTGVNGEMLTIVYGEKSFKVNSKLYQCVEEPRFKVGELVEVIEKNIGGRIEDIFWHVKNAEPYYILEIQGRKSGMWYKDCDLRKQK